MKQTPCIEDNSFSTGKNSTFFYHIQKNPPLVHITSHMTIAHIFIVFNIILPSKPTSSLPYTTDNSENIKPEHILWSDILRELYLSQLFLK